MNEFDLEVDVFYQMLSYWTPFEKALRWHGLHHNGKPFRVVEVEPSLRMHKNLGMLSQKILLSYDELVVIPFDSWAIPLCAL